MDSRDWKWMITVGAWVFVAYTIMWILILKMTIRAVGADS